MTLTEARELNLKLNPAVVGVYGSLREMYVDGVERGTHAWDYVVRYADGDADYRLGGSTWRALPINY